VLKTTGLLTTHTEHFQLGIIDEVKYNQGFPSSKDFGFVTSLRRPFGVATDPETRSNVIPFHVMQTCRGRRGIAPIMLKLDTLPRRGRTPLGSFLGPESFLAFWRREILLPVTGIECRVVQIGPACNLSVLFQLLRSASYTIKKVKVILFLCTP
jgi:hypothetical protein